MNKLRLLLAVSALSLLLPGLALAELPAKLPDNLVWQTNDSDPIFASPEAERGGRFREFMTSFPLTLRLVGPDSNGVFAGHMRSNNLGLVGFHPNTKNPIPELATHWAFGDDGKSIYYKLDPQARWSDGKPVTAEDYLYTLEFMRSSHILAPWYNNHFTERVVQVRKYDEHTIAIEGGSFMPQDELIAEISISPTPEHFHVLDKNWVRAFNWKVAPNTGAYRICDIRKGKYIEFCRKDDWWANDRRFFKHRFNPDYIRIKVIRDANIAYQHFRKGDLDTFNLIQPRFWHKKAQGRIYDKGLVAKLKFYNDTPQPALGIYMNESDPMLADASLRYGLAHAFDIDKVIRTVLRNDYERLNTMNEGYGDYSNTSIKARAFDLAKADQYLASAGWVERDSDGIRIKNGERLSLRVTYVTGEHTPRLVVIKEEARKAGVELQLQLLDPSAGFKQILEKKHQLAWMGWSGGGLSPRYRQFFHSSFANKPQNNNITNTSVPAFDALIEDYRAAREKSERVALARSLEQMVYDQGSVVPTYKVPYTRAAFWRWIRLPGHFGTRSTTSLFSPYGSTGGLFWIDQNEKDQLSGSGRGAYSGEPINIENSDWRVQ